MTTYMMEVHKMTHDQREGSWETKSQRPSTAVTDTDALTEAAGLVDRLGLNYDGRVVIHKTTKDGVFFPWIQIKGGKAK